MIENVKILNFRGVSADFKLGMRTLFTGPNSSGKSARTDAIQWGLLGCTPGHSTSEAASNVSGEEMVVELTLEGKLLKRALRVSGDTTSESITINGIEAKGRGKASTMIQMAFGAEPRIVNMAEFWAMAPGEQRAALLRLCGGGADITALEKAVEDAKLKVSLARSEREGAEGSLMTLTDELSKRQRPAGDFAGLQKRLQEFRSELAVVNERVRTGRSNDEMREKLKQARETLPELRKRHKADGDSSIAIMGRIAAAQKKLEALTAAPPVAPKSTQLVKPGGKVEALLKEVATFLGGMKPSTSQAALYAKVMGAITPTDTKAAAIHEQATKKWQGEINSLTATIQTENNTANTTKASMAQIQGQIAVMEQLERDAKAIGAGAKDEDVATVSGLEKQIAETEGALKPMADANATERSLDRAKMAAQTAGEKEQNAKAALGRAQEAVRNVILDAAHVFAVRAGEVLPSGSMVIEEGARQSLVFAWEMKDKSIRQRPSMSGSERVIFDAAVGHAFSPSAMVVIEAAELDTKRLPELMKRLAGVKFQVALSSWHAPKDAIEGWEVLKVG